MNEEPKEQRMELCPFGNDHSFNDERVCPFQSEINDNDEPYCHCCEECANECAMDI